MTIAQDSFAVGIYEVTFAEWDACAAAGGCRHRPGDGGWGRGRQPVIDVSWDDSQAVRHLALVKDRPVDYRLLTESEWEYVVRASRHDHPVPHGGEHLHRSGQLQRH